LYHCTPSELDCQPANVLSLHREFWNMEKKKEAKEVWKNRKSKGNNKGGKQYY
jgi:hypothetical protein